MDYEALKFRPDDYAVGNGWVKCLSTAHKAKVEKVVGVTDKSDITDSIDGPGIQVWFLMDCMARSGSSFTVLYDGEDTWIPIRRDPIRFGPHPTTLDPPNGQDKALFDRAVQEFEKAD